MSNGLHLAKHLLQQVANLHRIIGQKQLELIAG